MSKKPLRAPVEYWFGGWEKIKVEYPSILFKFNSLIVISLLPDKSNSLSNDNDMPTEAFDIFQIIIEKWLD